MKSSGNGQTHKKIRGGLTVSKKDSHLLSSAEVSQLWGSYMGESSQVCMFSYFLKIAEDKQTKDIVEFAYHTSVRQLDEIKKIFKSEGRAIPHGFHVEEDISPTAKKVYTDDFILEYIHQFARMGLRAHGINLSVVQRQDCMDYYKKCLTDAMKLYEMLVELLTLKGKYQSLPEVPPAKEVDYIQRQSFLSGFLGDKRPLTAPEITNLYANFHRNALGAGLMIGFLPSTRSEEVKKYLIRGKEIAEKHCEIFQAYLKDNDLYASLHWDKEVIPQDLKVFSEKLMMFIASALTSAGIGFYGLGLGTSYRRDLGVSYNRLLGEIELYAEDGTNIMIDKGWLESPPKMRV